MDLWDKILPLASVALGSLLTWLPSHYSNRKRQNAEAFAVRKAIAAEVESLIAVVRARNYLERFRFSIDQIREDEHEANRLYEGDPEAYFQTKLPVRVNIPEGYNRIFLSNIDKLGNLGPETAKDVVMFYAYMGAIFQDLSPGGILYEGATSFHYKEALSLLIHTLELGERVAHHRGEYY